MAKIGNTLGANCESFSLQDVQLLSYRADMIVNTLPLGMYNEKSIIDVQYIPSDSIVYDVVYRPVLTDFLKMLNRQELP